MKKKGAFLSKRECDSIRPERPNKLLCRGRKRKRDPASAAQKKALRSTKGVAKDKQSQGKLPSDRGGGGKRARPAHLEKKKGNQEGSEINVPQ